MRAACVASAREQPALALALADRALWAARAYEECADASLVALYANRAALRLRDPDPAVWRAAMQDCAAGLDLLDLDAEGPAKMRAKLHFRRAQGAVQLAEA